MAGTQLHEAQFLWHQAHVAHRHPSSLRCRRPDVQSQHPRHVNEIIQSPTEMLGIAPRCRETQVRGKAHFNPHQPCCPRGERRRDTLPHCSEASFLPGDVPAEILEAVTLLSRDRGRSQARWDADRPPAQGREGPRSFPASFSDPSSTDELWF